MTKKTNEIAAASNSAINASFDLALKSPLPYGTDKTLDKITVRRPLSGDLRGVKLTQLAELDTNVLFILLPRITMPAINESHVQQLDARDALAIMQEISVNFFTE